MSKILSIAINKIGGLLSGDGSFKDGCKEKEIIRRHVRKLLV